MPVAFAQTLLKFDGVCGATVEELSKFQQNESSLLLKHVQRQVKYFLVTWMESVTTIIFKISCERMVWLILHLMEKNLASEKVTLIAW